LGNSYGKETTYYTDTGRLIMTKTQDVMMSSTERDEESLSYCNDILINLSLGKMNGRENNSDTSLYKSILLQNLLNSRLVERAEGVTPYQQRKQEMRFILFKRRTTMCENAPWSSSHLSRDSYRRDDVEMETNTGMEPKTMKRSDDDAKTVKQRGRAPLRIRLVMKGRASEGPSSPKRTHGDMSDSECESDYPDTSDLEVKRRCGERAFASSPPPTPPVEHGPKCMVAR